MSTEKCALVLGNGAYTGELSLRSPRNDAISVAEALRRLRFDVTVEVDLEHARTTNIIDEFILKIIKVRPYVTVIYYSGHGLQFHDQNFLVPVDFEAEEDLRLISVQEIIDRVAECSTMQIVLLDACRSNFNTEQRLRGKGLVVNGQTAAVKAVEHALPGLAEMTGPSSTFIAFAAAPGDVAFDGGTLLSPFTEAFLKNVELVDLPLSNLMSRVRQDVYRATGQEQRTWDHSSLMNPFYFNPGSMFMFMGNAIALLGLTISMIPYSILLASSENTWTLTALALIYH